ncbi:unnamed protein product [Amoebophrya sp. A25]|nr:unnamed protein product [Amoebophrya sp. A25]|eukprot:GSA25T00004656001.1
MPGLIPQPKATASLAIGPSASGSSPSTGSGQVVRPAVPREATSFLSLVRHRPTKYEADQFQLNVKITYLNKTVKHTFSRSKGVNDQVATLCDMRDVPFDEDASYQILLRSNPKHLQKYAIGEDDFAKLEDGQEVRLVGGSDFVNTTLQKIAELSTSEKVGQGSADELLRWADSLLKNCSVIGPIGEWFASEVISFKGIGILFAALLNVQRSENTGLMEKIVGVFIGILTILLQFEAGIVWTEKEMVLDVDLLEAIACVLFGKMPGKAASLVSTGADRNDRRDAGYALNTRKLASAFLCTILQQFHKDVPLQLHRALMRQPDTSTLSYYQLMTELKADDPLYNLVLVVYLFLVDQEDIRQQVFRYFDAELSGSAATKWKKRGNAPDKSKKMLVEDSLLSSLATACADNERLELSGGTPGGGGHSLATGSESVDNLKATLRKMDDRRRKVEADLRRMHQAMCKMVELVDVENALVNQSLRAIVRYGWDSIHWQKGYTCLHFAAECMDAPNVVELLALLAKDMNERDATGKRPLDYARKEKKQANVDVLEKMRNQFYRQQQAERAIKKKRDVDYAKQVEIPENLTPTLRAGIEAVLQMGWRRIKWPNGFSALHLAAQCGNLEVIKILLEQVEHVSDDWQAKDKLGNTALDYAVSSKHEGVAEYLRNYDPVTMGPTAAVDDEAMSLSPGPLPQRAEMDLADAGKRRLPDLAQVSGASGGLPQAMTRLLPTRVPDSVTDEALRKLLEDILSKGYGGVSRMIFDKDKTPLHGACERGDLPVAKFLVQLGADPYKKDQSGKTAIKYAEDAGFKELAETIKREWKTMAESLNSASDSASLIAQIYALNKALTESHDALEELSGQRDAMETLAGDKLQLEQRVFFLQEWINGKRLDEIGALHDEQMETYGKQLELVGVHKLRAKLMENKMQGGLNLALHDAALGVEKLLFAGGKGAAAGIRQNILDAEGFIKIVGGHMTPRGGGGAAGPEPASPGGKPGKPAAKGAPPKGATAPKGGAPPGKGAPGPPGKAGAAPPGKGAAAPGKGAAPAKGAPKGAKGAAGGAKGKGKKGKETGPGGVKIFIDPNLRMPGIIPPKPMKPLWWNRLIIGKQIKEEATVWDIVENYAPTLLAEDSATTNEFVERFSKAKGAGGDGEEKEVKKKELRELIVITDSNKAVAKQKLCKGLPSPEILCAAILEFDDTVIDKDMLEGIKLHCIPDAGELAAMEKLRAEHPDVPWALPEKYLWAVGHIPVYEQRIQCWHFTRNYEERLLDYEAAYADFTKVVDALETASALQSLLGVALAAGNYLNGNTNRGQADGFDLSGLPMFSTIKDNLDDKIRVTDWIFRMFLKDSPLFVKARKDIMVQLAPVFKNVKRRVGKNKDGVVSMTKQVKYANEEFDGMVRALKEEFDGHNGNLQMILGFFEDPTDPIRTVLVPEFEAVDKRIKALLQVQADAQNKMASIQDKFNLGKMMSTELLLLLDDFLIPPDLIVNKPEDVQKKVFIPLFCGLAAPTFDAMMFLWGLEDPMAALLEEQKRGARRPKRGARAQNRRGKRVGAAAADPDDSSEDEEAEAAEAAPPGEPAAPARSSGS